MAANRVTKVGGVCSPSRPISFLAQSTPPSSPHKVGFRAYGFHRDMYSGTVGASPSCLGWFGLHKLGRVWGELPFLATITRDSIAQHRAKSDTQHATHHKQASQNTAFRLRAPNRPQTHKVWAPNSRWVVVDDPFTTQNGHIGPLWANWQNGWGS